jgi:hypothetical protein
VGLTVLAIAIIYGGKNFTIKTESFVNNRFLIPWEISLRTLQPMAEK